MVTPATLSVGMVVHDALQLHCPCEQTCFDGADGLLASKQITNL